MAYQVVMPRLGWQMEKGRLVEWLKRDGDTVQVGETLFTVESDKALQEVEALDSGILRLAPGAPPPGTDMPVGTLLAYLLKPGEQLPAAQPGLASGQPHADARESAFRPSEPLGRAGAPASLAAPPQPRQKVAISPRARRVARELGVEWGAIRGSGRTGRIVERDIRRAASESSRALAIAAPPLGPVAHAAVGVGSLTDLGARPAAVTLHTEADATELAALAERFVSAWPQNTLQVPASLCLLCRLVALALQEHPLLNASLQEGQIVLHRSVHLSLAIAGENAFRWPVIRDVSQLSVQRIAEEANRLQEHVRAGSLALEDTRGGTFSLIDLGDYGVDTFTPLIMAPQSAVLGLGRIALVPAVYQGQIVPRHKLSLSLTFDHRIVDGAPAARFLRAISAYVEQPYRWLFR